MPVNSRQLNILENTDKVFLNCSKNSRQEYLAHDFVTKLPTFTMKTLATKFGKTTNTNKRDHILSQMFNVWLAESKMGPVYTKDEVQEYARLRKFVCMYYRHEFQEASNAQNDILLHEAFEILKLIDNPDDIGKTKWIALITAATQSGKTFLMIALCHIYTAFGYDSVFIVKDISQTFQLMSRKKSKGQELCVALEEAGFSSNIIDMFGPPIYHDSSMGDAHYSTFMDQIDCVMNRSRRRSITCIHNAAHLKRLYESITVHSKICLHTDEAHKLGAYKILGNDTTQTISESAKEGSYDRMYLNLKVHVYKIFLYTATPQGILAVEPNLFSDSIVLLPEGKDYRGIETWEFKILPTNAEEKYIEMNGVGKEGGPVQSKVPESFFEVMAELSVKEPIDRINKFGIRDKLPIGLIGKFEVTNYGQSLLLASLKPDADVKNEYHKKIINVGWSVIVFNMFGVRFYDNSLRCNTIKICDKKYTDNDGSGEFLFDRNVQVGDVLHWMWTNGGHSRFPHYVIFTYKSAEEGITFSSTWGETEETDGNIHPSFMYSRMGDGVSAPNKEQASGRMNGNHGDTDLKGRPLLCTHWDTMAGKETLIKGVNMHRQMLKDICSLKFKALNGQVMYHVKNYSMFKNRVPKNFFGSIPGAQRLIKKVNNPHAKVEQESFTRYKRVLNTLQMINPGVYDPTHKRLNRAIDRMAMDANEDNDCIAPTVADIRVYGFAEYTNILNKFDKWRTASSSISKFVQALMTSKTYTSNEFSVLCKETGVEATHTQHLRYGSSNGYGRIIEKVDNKFRLYPVLRHGLRNALEYVV